MGAHIAQDAYVSASVDIVEADLLEVGPGAVVGDMVKLQGFLFEHGQLRFRKVKIGANCHVGALSVLDPGCELRCDVRIKPLRKVSSEKNSSDVATSRCGESLADSTVAPNDHNV